MGADLNVIYQFMDERLKEFRKKNPELGKSSRSAKGT